MCARQKEKKEQTKFPWDNFNQTNHNANDNIKEIVQQAQHKQS